MLACCVEVAAAVRSGDPTKYVSHTPVHQVGGRREGGTEGGRRVEGGGGREGGGEGEREKGIKVHKHVG